MAKVLSEEEIRKLEQGNVKGEVVMDLGNPASEEEVKQKIKEQVGYDPFASEVEHTHKRQVEYEKQPSNLLNKVREQGEVATTFRLPSADIKYLIPNYPTVVSFSKFYVSDEKVLASCSEAEYLDTLVSLLNAKAVIFKDDNNKVYEGFRIEDLIIGDFDTLLLYLRAKFCGVTTDISYQCDCGRYNSITFDLRKLNFEKPKDDYREPLTVKVGGDVLKLRLPRVNHLLLSEREKNETDAEYRLLSGCLYGYDFGEDYIEFENMDIEKKRYVKTFFKLYNYSVDATVSVKCSFCGEEVALLIPFRKQGFFESSELSEEDFRKAMQS